MLIITFYDHKLPILTRLNKQATTSLKNSSKTPLKVNWTPSLSLKKESFALQIQSNYEKVESLHEIVT